MDTENIVLAMASKYDKKYYFNPKYELLPREIKLQIKKLLVAFVETVGGTISIEMDKCELVFKTSVLDSDIYYDDIESRLLINRITKENEELLNQLYTYLSYKNKMKESNDAISN